MNDDVSSDCELPALLLENVCAVSNGSQQVGLASWHGQLSLFEHEMSEHARVEIRWISTHPCGSCDGCTLICLAGWEGGLC